MLKLKNIKMNNGIITAEYEPENSGNFGSIAIDIKTGEILKAKTSEMDIPLPIYLNHATDTLKEIMNEKTLPKEKLVMWY